MTPLLAASNVREMSLTYCLLNIAFFGTAFHFNNPFSRYCMVVSEEREGIHRLWEELDARGWAKEQLVHFAVVQDPLERFLDHFLERCVK